MEKVGVWNFIREVIVKGMLINRNVGRYIREKEGGLVDKDDYRMGDDWLGRDEMGQVKSKIDTGGGLIGDYRDYRESDIKERRTGKNKKKGKHGENKGEGEVDSDRDVKKAMRRKTTKRMNKRESLS